MYFLMSVCVYVYAAALGGNAPTVYDSVCIYVQLSAFSSSFLLFLFLPVPPSLPSFLPTRAPAACPESQRPCRGCRG